MNNIIQQTILSILHNPPQKTAYSFNNKDYSYSDMVEKINFYRKSTSALTAVKMQPSIELVAVILACYANNIGYVPIDHNAPPARVNAILNDAKPQVLITDAGIEYLEQSLDEQAIPKPYSYIMYTSGSTGMPKGVCVSPLNINSFYVSFIDRMKLSEQDSFMAMSSITFDIAFVEFIIPFLLKASCTIVNKNTLQNYTELASLITKTKPSVLQITPSRFNLLKAFGFEGMQNTKLLFAGEKVQAAKLNREFEKFKSVFNLYGPTEATVYVATHQLQSETDCAVGKPLDGVVLTINNNQLHVHGSFVSMGYLNHPELTDEKFTHSENKSVYATGDSCHIEDDCYYIDDRIDDQVKINGYRIECGEVESLAKKIDSVTMAYAYKNEADIDELKLIVATDEPKKQFSEIKNKITALLEEHLLASHRPSEINVLAANVTPLTLAGKLDKKALRSMNFTQEDQHDNIIESTVCNIANQDLQLDPNTSLFEYGLSSLQILKVMLLLNQHFAKSCEIADFIQNPSLQFLKDFYQGNVSTENTMLSLEQLTEDVGYIKLPIFSKSKTVHGTKTILLTGGSGFLGNYLSHKLQEYTNEYTIIALLRRHSINAFSKKFPGIQCIEADLEHEQFGLSDASYQQLSSCVDIIIHAAASVEFSLDYKTQFKRNVNPAKNIIDFSANHNIKPIIHISTYSVYPMTTVQEAQAIAENYENPRGTVFPNAYGASKWCVEALMNKARAGGLPVSIIRPGIISGSISDSHWPENSLSMRFLSHCIQLQQMPDIHFKVDLTPVEHVADCIVACLRHEYLDNKNYHVINPNFIDYKNIMDDIIQLHPSIQIADYALWRQTLCSNEQSPLYPLQLLFPENPLDVVRFKHTPAYDTANAQRLMDKVGLQFMDDASMRHYLKNYLINLT